MEFYEELGFQTKAQWEFPTIINLNVFRGACPCNCVHCPVGNILPLERDKHFRRSELDLDLYKKIVNEISEINTVSLLRIHSVGEPILWSKLIEAVRYSRNKKVKTWIFTSALTTDRQLLMTLCENADIIEVSVNSFTKEDYLKTKGVDQFELIMDNILFMSDYIAVHQLKTRLLLSRVQSHDSELDNEFVKYWSQFKGISDVFIRSYHNYNGLLGHKTKIESIQPCLVHWGRFNIDVNGDVVVCFNELFHKNIKDDYILGNVNFESIKSIWQSEKMNAIRLFLLRKRKDSVKIPCLTCTTRQPYPSKNVTSEKQLVFLK